MHEEPTIEPRDNAHPAPPGKLLASPGVKIRLALACVLVLALGLLLAPRAAQPPLTIPQERPAPLLEEQLQLRRPAAPAFSGVSAVVDALRAYTVPLPPAGAMPPSTRTDFLDPPARLRPPAGFGVWVSDRHVLTHWTALGGQASIHVADAEGAAVLTLDAYDPSTGLVLLISELPSGMPAPMASDPAATGTLTVGVGRLDGGERALPVFVSGWRDGMYALDAPAASTQPGLPLFTLEGELLGIAVPSEDGAVAYPAREATGRLLARAIAGDVPASFGLRLQAVAGPTAAYFGGESVVVTAVTPGGPADAAGLEAGDVLLSIGDMPVDALDTVLQALRSRPLGGATSIRLRRSGAERTFDVTPIAAYEAAHAARQIDDGAGGLEVRELLDADVRRRAAIPATARVIAVNGRTVATRAEAARALRARDPAVLLLRYGGEAFFTAIEPAP